MGLVPAKCSQCGANIQVDPSKEAGICPNCGTAFITEKVIHNYNITNNMAINNATFTIEQERENYDREILFIRYSDKYGKTSATIFVDDKEYGRIYKFGREKIMVDSKKAHRIYCVCGNTKSNTVFISPGDNMNVIQIDAPEVGRINLNQSEKEEKKIIDPKQAVMVNIIIIAVGIALALVGIIYGVTLGDASLAVSFGITGSITAVIGAISAPIVYKKAKEEKEKAEKEEREGKTNKKDNENKKA